MERYASRRKDSLRNIRQEKTDGVVKTNLCAPSWVDTGYGLLSFLGLAASHHELGSAHKHLARLIGPGSGSLQTTPITSAVNTPCPVDSWDRTVRPGVGRSGGKSNT